MGDLIRPAGVAVFLSLLNLAQGTLEFRKFAQVISDIALGSGCFEQSLRADTD